jgi:RNA polymerase sigma-70 factor, ECF subfamily
VRTSRTGAASVSGADELRLVERARSGDASAFEKLYEACVDRVYRYIFFRVTDVNTAEDLTSEVFLKAWQNIHRYHPKGPFVAWLYAIARNTVIDHYRTRKPTVSLDEVVSAARHDAKLDEKVDLDYDVKELQAALQHLTEEQREVLTLKFIGDLETAEIARRMRKSEGAIRALQMRALQALARVMESDGR